jgi:hypothetical protein
MRVKAKRAIFSATGMVCLGLFFSGNSQAETYGFAGCGAGTRIFGPRNWQTSASTTNHGTIPVASGFIGVPTSQPWSITFDFAGCGEDAMQVAYFDQYNYTFQNFAALAKEAARGEGQTLEGLAAQFGCPKSAYRGFCSFVKSQYSTIFAQPGVRATFLELNEKIHGDSVLMATCIKVQSAETLQLAQANHE